MGERGHIGFLAVIGIIWLAIVGIRITAAVLTASSKHWQQSDKLALDTRATPRPL